MSLITKIPTIHIQKYGWGGGVYEVSLMMPHSVNQYYMTEAEIKAFVENILGAFEKSKIILVPSKVSQVQEVQEVHDTT